jgi:hypothetical protein
MCLSVSGRLRLRRSKSKGLSPDSSYRDAVMIHDPSGAWAAQPARPGLCGPAYPPDFFAGHPSLISSATITSR